MNEVSVIIPNYNGIQYLENCLDSLRRQTTRAFETILVDNGSTDGSVALVQEQYPEVRLICLSENFGFSRAVNVGIQASDAPFAILLNNDTEAAEDFVEELLRAARSPGKIFSWGAKMLSYAHRDTIDDAGDYFCALGWAFARGKGKPAARYDAPCRIFAACAGAALYNKAVFEEIGYFDEEHFAYLEDVDVCYRARIFGYENRYVPTARVFHVGSGTTGSRYNQFKIRYASRNSIYMLYKNMPIAQIILNLPFLLAGFLAKILFFTAKGMGREYIAGIKNGFSLAGRGTKVRFRKKHWKNYVRIQWELWVNVVRRFL